VVAIWLELRQYILLYKIPEGDHNMNPNQDDKTTTRHMVITFLLFIALGIFLIIGANIIG